MTPASTKKADGRRYEYFARLEQALEARGRKQTWLEVELAKSRGTASRGAMSNLKRRGVIAIDIEVAEETARLLDVDPCWLVLGRGKMGRYTARAPLAPELERVVKALAAASDEIEADRSEKRPKAPAPSARAAR